MSTQSNLQRACSGHRHAYFLHVRMNQVLSERDPSWLEDGQRFSASVEVLLGRLLLYRGSLQVTDYLEVGSKVWGRNRCHCFAVWPKEPAAFVHSGSPQLLSQQASRVVLALRVQVVRSSGGHEQLCGGSLGVEVTLGQVGVVHHNAACRPEVSCT